MSGASEPSPYHGHGKPVSRRDAGQCGGMTEGIRAVGHARRRGTEPTQHASASLEIAEDCLAGGDEVVGQDIPRTGLQLTRLQPRP